MKKSNDWKNEPYGSRLQLINEVIKQPPFYNNVLIRNDIFSPKLRLSYLGHLKLDEEQKKRSKHHATTLKEKKQPNDLCGIFIHDPVLTGIPVLFNYHSLFYSEILALREQGRMIKMISTNVLVFCEDNQCVLAHQRSQQCADYSGALHTFGGAFMPTVPGQKGDFGGFKVCVERELFEETGISITVPKTTPFVIIEEPSIFFIEIAFLGVNITGEQAYRAYSTWEGAIVKIPFDHLLTNQTSVKAWTPSGVLLLLLWLALDTPDCQDKLIFGGKDAFSQLELIIDNL